MGAQGVDAVVVAGCVHDESEEEFRDALGVTPKAMVPVDGWPMVAWVVAALKSAPSIGRVVVVGPHELQRHPYLSEADALITAVGGRSESFFAALDYLRDASRVLVVNCDIPLASAQDYEELLRAFPEDTDVGYTLVRAEVALAKYGDRQMPRRDSFGVQKPNWEVVRLRDGRFVATPCLLVRPEAARRCRPLIKRIFDDRRVENVLRTLGPLLGFWFLVRLGLALKVRGFGWFISLSAIEKRIATGLGLICRCNVSDCAELALDVDHVSDLAIVGKALRRAREGNQRDKGTGEASRPHLSLGP